MIRGTNFDDVFPCPHLPEENLEAEIHGVSSVETFPSLSLISSARLGAH